MQKRSDTPGDPQVPGGRGVRVRSRLVAGVALVGITVIGAGTPAVLTASKDLNDSQRLVTLAQLNRQAVTLAHSLADERDEVTAYISAGRDGKRAVDAAHRARVDRQIDEIRADAPAELRRDLATVASVRRTALTGKGTALEAHRAYGEVITKLQALAAELADRTPARAEGNGTRALAELGQAVEQASRTRGLLLAALAVPEPETTGETVYDPVTGQYVERKDPGADGAGRARDDLAAAAQRARVREQAALDDFDQTAGPAVRDRLTATVTGPEVKSAEDHLARLTDRPELSEDDLRTDEKQLGRALSARIEQMRGVESALATEQVERMERLRDDDVTALELRVALLGGCLLIAVGVSTAVARTLTRPLAVLRLGAARIAAAPESEEPIRFTGRNDEFAQVVRSLNALHAKLLDLFARAERLDAERTGVNADREALTAELAAQRAELRDRTAELTAELERLRHSVHHTFVNLSLRTLGLVERQLAVIEKLEDREQDPDRLSTLFKLDHMATVMRRHSENLLVLAGHEHNHANQVPVPLVDVLRAAVSEIERYERVTIQSLPPHAHVAGYAADDLSHLLAELLENATSFSPPDSEVRLSGWLLENGEVMLSVQDEGIGMTETRLDEINARLADPDRASQDPAPDDGEGEGLGIRVAALLAARHGVRVHLREQKQGGVTAVAVLPQSLLPEPPSAQGSPAVAGAGGEVTLNLPGSVAEANSNTLPGRVSREGADPLIEAARATEEKAASEPRPDAEPEPEPDAESRSASEAESEAGSPSEPAPDAETASGGASGPETASTAGAGAESAPVSEPVSGPAPEAEAESGAVTAETTLQVRVPRPAGAPEGAPERGPIPEPAPGPEAEPETEPEAEPASGGRPEAPRAGGPGGPEGARGPGGTQEPPAPGKAQGSRQTRKPQRAHEPKAPEPHEPHRPTEPREPRQDTGPHQDRGTREPVWERVTDKGLPKRTPKIVRPTARTTGRKSGVDAEALRRRLGGFQRGAEDGRRDAEAEIAEATQQLEAVRTEETGDTVEEARS